MFFFASAVFHHGCRKTIGPWDTYCLSFTIFTIYHFLIPLLLLDKISEVFCPETFCFCPVFVIMNYNQPYVVFRDLSNLTQMITGNIDWSPELCLGFEKMSPCKSSSMIQMKSSRIYFEKIGSIKVISFWKSRSLFGPY